MKKISTLTVLLVCAVLTCSNMPVSAETVAETDVPAQTEAVSEEENGSNSKMVGGALMLASVFAASWVSMLIFRGRDKTKYL